MQARTRDELVHRYTEESQDPAKEKVRRVRRTSRKVATMVVTVMPMVVVVVVVQTEKEEEVGRGS